MPIEAKGKILVVEDEVGTGYALKLLLDLEFYEVIIAADGDEAIALARMEPPDAIITDINMPRVNGLEIIKRLKRERRLSDVPVIVISAAESRQLALALELGACGAWEKPLDFDRFLPFIASVVEDRQERTIGPYSRAS